MKKNILYVMKYIALKLFVFCLITCVQNETLQFKTCIFFKEPNTLELFLYYQDIPKRSRHIAKDIKEINFHSVSDDKVSLRTEISFINPPNGNDPIEISYYKEYVHILFKEIEILPFDILFRSNGIQKLYLKLDYNDINCIKINIIG